MAQLTSMILGWHSGKRAYSYTSTVIVYLFRLKKRAPFGHCTTQRHCASKSNRVFVTHALPRKNLAQAQVPVRRSSPGRRDCWQCPRQLPPPPAHSCYLNQNHVNYQYVTARWLFRINQSVNVTRMRWKSGRKKQLKTKVQCFGSVFAVWGSDYRFFPNAHLYLKSN